MPMSIGLVYARESLRKDDLAIDRQVDLGTAAVRTHRLIPEVYTEAPGHHSGKGDKNRPEWRRVKKRLADPDVKMLWVADISRASRSHIEILQLIETLQARKIELVSHRENVDTHTASGRLTLGIIAQVNQHYVEDMAERATVRTEYLKTQGVPLGPSPQGLKTQGRGTERKFIPDEDACYSVDGHERTALDTVQAWLELFTGPVPIGVVRGAQFLNAQGYRYLDHHKVPHLIKAFNLQKLNKTIFDPKDPARVCPYTGILDAALLARARARIVARARHAQNGHPQSYPPLLLQRLVRCALCKRRFTTEHKASYYRKRGERVKGSQVASIYRHGLGECPTVVLRHQEVEEPVLKKLSKIATIPPDRQEAFLAKIGQSPPDPHAARRSFLQAKLLRLEKYLVDGSISEVTYKKERPPTEQELAELPPPPPPQTQTPDEIRRRLTDIAHWIGSLSLLDPYAARETIGYYVETVWVRGRKVEQVDLQPWLRALDT
jgi:DNA invertase Pin-like site-specific DNA recombinase